ncbi:hypothetical protein [Paracoccus aminovorans]|uniref:hypothetical protein n=1 Tax=Paracoccus aminovorans TaxID=34004 RepID=UPI002B25E8AB|nr:hypothetical protein [Paracoccus aminovorans]
MAGDLIEGFAGYDECHWTGGAETIIGGADTFDANPHTPGNPGGDRLFIEGPGAFVRLDAGDTGIAQLGSDG